MEAIKEGIESVLSIAVAALFWVSIPMLYVGGLMQSFGPDGSTFWFMACVFVPPVSIISGFWFWF